MRPIIEVTVSRFKLFSIVPTPVVASVVVDSCRVRDVVPIVNYSQLFTCWSILNRMDGAEQDTFERPPHEEPEFVDLLVGPGRTSDNRRFGGLLTDIREHAGLTRAEVARALDLSAEYLRLIELGKRTPALGQMEGFLKAYRVKGAVGRLQPGGDRPDLLIFPPYRDDPTIVEFTSRIREARRSTASSSGGVSDPRREPDFHERLSDDSSVSHAADLGHVVFLLARADHSTIRKVRDLLQAEDNSVSPET